MKSELEKTKEYLRQTRNAIIGRGGEISLTAGLKDLPDAILAVPQDASVAFYVDSGVAHRKSVPEGASRFAYLNRIGGMTHEVADTLIATVTEVRDGFPTKIEFEYTPSIPFKIPTPTEYGGYVFSPCFDARGLGLYEEYSLRF